MRTFGKSTNEKYYEANNGTCHIKLNTKWTSINIKKNAKRGRNTRRSLWSQIVEFHDPCKKHINSVRFQKDVVLQQEKNVKAFCFHKGLYIFNEFSFCHTK